MMHPMGMRSVAMGSTSCFQYCLRTAQWTEGPDVPIGKLYPTLVTVENRFIFQIGGFDDYDYEIYRLDTLDNSGQVTWTEIKIREEIAILKTVDEIEVSSESEGNVVPQKTLQNNPSLEDQDMEEQQLQELINDTPLTLGKAVSLAEEKHAIEAPSIPQPHNSGLIKRLSSIKSRGQEEVEEAK